MTSPRFSPRATTVFRAGIVGLVLLVIGAGFAWYCCHHSPYWWMTGVALDQPVLFSHRHHASELRIDCRYCHDAMETSSALRAGGVQFDSDMARADVIVPLKSDFLQPSCGAALHAGLRVAATREGRASRYLGTAG